jgi:hypothetical protein
VALIANRRRYVLEHSVGFTVEAQAGTIGIIEEVTVGAEGAPETLVVRVEPNGHGAGVVIVPVQRVGEVRLDERRVVLSQRTAA